MTFSLMKQGIKPVYENFESDNIYVLQKSQYEEKQYSFTTPSINSPAGNQVRVSLTFPPNTNQRIRDIYMTWTASNSSAVLAPTFRNIFLTMNTVKCLINLVEVYYYMDNKQIMCAVQDYLRAYDENSYFSQLNRWRSETGKTCVGETIPVSSSTIFTIPLTVLFPFLKGMIINQKIYQLDFEILFAIDTSSLLNAQYVVSNTTSNAYVSGNLSYTNIKINILWDNNSDVRLLKNVYPTVMLLNKWETKLFTQSWNVVNVDNLQLDLTSVWGKHTKIIGVLVFIQPAAIPAFNDASAALFYSGANYIAFEILSNSSIVVTQNSSSSVSWVNATTRRRYAMDFNKRRYGVDMPIQVISNTSNISNVYSFETYIDLADITVDAKDEIPISGISNYNKDISINLYCAGSVSANANIYCMLNYIELGTFEGNNNNVVLLK